MLKVSKKSWHYKVFNGWHKARYGYAFDGSDEHVSLCQYVRAVILWAPLYLLFTMPVLPFSLAALVFTAGWIVHHFTGWHGVLHVLAVFGIVAGTLALICVVVLGCEKAKDNESVTSFRDIVGARIEAAHDKVCPLIKFE